MGPDAFLAPPTPEGLPAPLWFLTLFKVIGFVLHLWPMHLFFLGSVTAAVLARRGEPASRLAGRLGRVLPFAVALGVNFGIVPLLFVQVSHYRVFYPTTILIAWPWFAIIPALIVAYYGIYAYAVAVRADRVGAVGRNAIAAAALLLVWIGFVFANNFSLMTNPARWQGIFERTWVSGAVTGLALNLGDPTLWPRWLMMVGLALCSTAAWIALDTAFFCAAESDSFRDYARRTALKLYLAGATLFGLMGTWYIFGALPAESRGFLLGGARLPLFLLTAVSPAFGLAGMLYQARPGNPARTWAVVPAHYLVLILNAVSRQRLQTFELSPTGILGADAVHVQWSTLPLFLVCFVVMLAVVVWMLRKVWVEAGLGGSPTA